MMRPIAILFVAASVARRIERVGMRITGKRKKLLVRAAMRAI